MYASNRVRLAIATRYFGEAVPRPITHPVNRACHPWRCKLLRRRCVVEHTPGRSEVDPFGSDGHSGSSVCVCPKPCSTRVGQFTDHRIGRVLVPTYPSTDAKCLAPHRTWETRWI